MARDGGSTAVPRLRFPAFRKAKGWHCIPGDQLFDQINNRDATAGIPILAITQEHGAIPRDQIDYHVSVTEKSIESYKVVEQGDFIISLRSFQGGIEYSNYRGICSPAYIVLRRKAAGSDHYFRYLFKSRRFIQELTRNIEGLRDGKMISYKQFSEQLIPTPGPVEQQKVADCLASLDEVIAAQRQKVDGLKAHKRGLVQALFPREGESLPWLRFPEFRGGAAWEETTIGQIVDFQSGGTPSKVNSAFWNGSIPWVSAKDMKRLFLEDTEDHITPAALGDKAKVVPAGTVLMLTRGMTLFNDLPICILRREMSFNQDVKALAPKAGLDGRFLPHLLQGNKARLLRMVDSAGHGTGRLNTEALKTLDVMLPQPAEQRRIADCLYVVDSLIPAESDRLEALKTQKKSLVQQLFPS